MLGKLIRGHKERLPEKMMLKPSLKEQTGVSRTETAEGTSGAVGLRQ